MTVEGVKGKVGFFNKNGRWKNVVYQVLPVRDLFGGFKKVTFSGVIFVTFIWGISSGHLEEAGIYCIYC